MFLQIIVVLLIWMAISIPLAIAVGKRLKKISGRLRSPRTTRRGGGE